MFDTDKFSDLFCQLFLWGRPSENFFVHVELFDLTHVCGFQKIRVATEEIKTPKNPATPDKSVLKDLNTTTKFYFKT